jgi:hypothetical protein
MNFENPQLIQLINTAIIKSKEKKINSSYEERLSKACKKPAIQAFAVAIESLSEMENISRDQAAISLIETVRELDTIWNDYVMIEGIGKLKELLKDKNIQ